MSIIVSIDPGFTGAIAVFWDATLMELFDMPLRSLKPVRKKNKKGKMVDVIRREIEGNTLGLIFQYISNNYGRFETYIEAVHAMPDQGVTSMFQFGYTYGVTVGVAEIYSDKIHKIPPATWKKGVGLIKTEKDEARLKAIALYKDYERELSRKKDIGRADAIMIGHYALQLKGQQ